jgi:hypothetical protein
MKKNLYRKNKKINKHQVLINSINFSELTVLLYKYENSYCELNYEHFKTAIVNISIINYIFPYWDTKN